MNKKWIMAVSLTLVLLAGLITAAAGCEATFSPEGVPEQITSGSIIVSQQNTGIWVTGQGKVSVTPDIAMLNLGVETQATTVAEAQEQARVAMDAIMNELDSQGIAEKDIKTQYFSIYPVRQWLDKENKEIIIGYRVTNMVTVKIRKVENTGAIIDAVAGVGGDYVRINSIGFTVDDPTEYYEEVRKLAMADAEEKAEQLANLADISLGKPTYISEGSIATPVTRDYMYEAGAPVPAPTTSISPGETEIQLNVQVVYSIK